MMTRSINPLQRWIALLMVGVFVVGCATNDMSRQFNRKFNPPSMAQQVAMVLDPDDPDRRREGIEYLANGVAAKEEETLKLFQLVAEDDSSAFVRSAAVSALGQGENPAFADTLIAALKDESPIVRAEAAEALRHTIAPEALRPLIAAAERDPDVSVRYQATRSLPAYRNEEAVGTLIYLLDDPELTVSREAHTALKALYGEDLGTDVAPWRIRAEQGLPPEEAPKSSRWKRWWTRKRHERSEAREETLAEEQSESEAWHEDYEARYGEKTDEEEAPEPKDPEEMTFWERFRAKQAEIREEENPEEQTEEIDLEKLLPGDPAEEDADETNPENETGNGEGETESPEDSQVDPEDVDRVDELGPAGSGTDANGDPERPVRPPALVTPDD